MKIVKTNNAPSAIGPYSQAVISGNLVYTSGQIPLSSKDGKVISGGIQEQTEAVINNLKAVLEESGSSISNVVKTTCFIKDMNTFEQFNEIYAKHFISLPARSCVEVSALPKGVGVEIEVIAELN